MDRIFLVSCIRGMLYDCLSDRRDLALFRVLFHLTNATTFHLRLLGCLLGARLIKYFTFQSSAVIGGRIGEWSRSDENSRQGISLSLTLASNGLECERRRNVLRLQQANDWVEGIRKNFIKFAKRKKLFSLSFREITFCIFLSRSLSLACLLKYISLSTERRRIRVELSASVQGERV